MASEARLKAGVLLAVGGIALLAFCAGALSGSPRLQVLCALAALPLLPALWRCLAQLARPARAPLVEAMESELGVPVYDSVAAVVWKALRLAGVDTRRVAGWGRLFGEVG